ncbi:MAG: hypothetical protein R2778_01575 [Saprospiraceae bacterium]
MKLSNRLQTAMALKHNKRDIGKTFKVLIERDSVSLPMISAEGAPKVRLPQATWIEAGRLC